MRLFHLALVTSEKMDHVQHQVQLMQLVQSDSLFLVAQLQLS